ncbi:MAG: hypothetical protein RBT34_02905 [Anaerolineaceae bacterium]|nr:hypothetical protein [Anaerolineaceae bacterium]
MPEKRELKRRHPVYYLQVTDIDSGENLGYLIDINAKGIMLAGQSALIPEKVFKIAIQLPEEMEGEQAIFLKVSSVWSEFDPLLEKTRNGFKIDESTPKELKKINWLIENFGFKA